MLANKHPHRNKILITRPEQDAKTLSRKLKELGYEPILLPMMKINFTTETLNLENIDRLIFTSANGVRAFVNQLDKNTPWQLPVYAVGEKTAGTLKSFGFKHIFTAQGNAEKLYQLILSHAPKTQFLYHARASNHPHKLAERLEKQGFQVRKQNLYHTVERTNLPKDFIDLLPQLKAIMLFSPRTAKVFLQLLQKIDWHKHIYDINFVCLSVQVRMHIQNELLGLPKFHTRSIVACTSSEDMMLKALAKIDDQDKRN